MRRTRCSSLPGESVILHGLGQRVSECAGFVLVAASIVPRRGCKPAFIVIVVAIHFHCSWIVCSVLFCPAPCFVYFQHLLAACLPNSHRTLPFLLFPTPTLSHHHPSKLEFLSTIDRSEPAIPGQFNSPSSSPDQLDELEVDARLHVKFSLLCPISQNLFVISDAVGWPS